jgi:membrane protein insertase Oxa1/YidC/SpoIIIJ
MYFALAIFLGFRGGGFHTWWKWKEDGQPGTMAPLPIVGCLLSFLAGFFFFGLENQFDCA